MTPKGEINFKKNLIDAPPPDHILNLPPPVQAREKHLSQNSFFNSHCQHTHFSLFFHMVRISESLCKWNLDW